MFNDAVQWLSTIETWKSIGVVVGAVLALCTLVAILAKAVKYCVNAGLEVADFFSKKIQDKKAKRDYLKLYRRPCKAGPNL